jgi:Phage integrase family
MLIFLGALRRAAALVQRPCLVAKPSTAPVAAAETLQLVLVMAAPQRPHHPRHALRHSFSSRLRENDADLALIQEALGHSNIATTIVYAHLPRPSACATSRGTWRDEAGARRPASRRVSEPRR